LVFFASRRRHTRSKRDWSSDVCSSDLYYLLALSAKTEQALEEKITDLIDYLESPEGQKADLLQVSYTLLNGRQHFRHRWAMVARSEERRVGKEWRWGRRR